LTDTYNEDTADEIAQAITSVYVDEFKKFLQRFTEMEAHEP